MARLHPIWVADENGTALISQALSFVLTFGYNAKVGGAARPRPLFGNRGGGQYVFRGSDDDEATGVCAIVDCGAGAVPRFQYLEVCGDENQFVMFVPFDENGAMSAGAPAVGSFVDLTNGGSRTPPAVVKMGAYEVYSATPSAADLAVGVGIRLDAPPGILPVTLNASFFAVPTPDPVPVPPAPPAAGGTIDDMCDVVDLLSSGSYSCIRRSPPAYVRGRRLKPAETLFTIEASVQPASGLEVQRLPEGKRNRETMVVFTCVELKTAEKDLQEPDLLSIDGGSFEVDSVQRWAALGNYYRAIVTRRPGT